MTDKSMIYQVALEIYRRYDIKSFPFDIFSLVIRAGFDVHKYSSLKPAKFEKVRLLSDSACLVGSTIYYNDAQIPERIRFSIAHELGHYFLQTADEDLADTFAAQFLAPAPLIRARGYRTSDEVQEAFRISTTAANRALFVGKKWTGYRLPKTAPEWLLIDWFDGIKTAPVIETTPEPVKPKPKRLPPLLSKEEKERLTPEQQKIIARIRRKRRKIAQELEDIEGQKNPIEEFGLLEAAMESWRQGEV